MATLLRDRHRLEELQRTRRVRELDAEPPRTATAGGDSRFRVPTIGLNSGHMPGTRPDTVGAGWYNQPNTAPAA